MGIEERKKKTSKLNKKKNKAFGTLNRLTNDLSV